MVIESTRLKTRIYDATVMIVCVCVSEHGVGEGMKGSCIPLPTFPQWYCDPASHVAYQSRTRDFLTCCLLVGPSIFAIPPLPWYFHFILFYSCGFPPKCVRYPMHYRTYPNIHQAYLIVWNKKKTFFMAFSRMKHNKLSPGNYLRKILLVVYFTLIASKWRYH